MTLLISFLLSLFPPTLADSIVGTWQRTLVTSDASTDTEETQTISRTFNADGSLHESVVYQQRVVWTDTETVVLQFRSDIQGDWFVDGRNVLVNYNPKSLSVHYEGVSFPDRDAALQASLRAAFQKKNSKYVRNYVKTMVNVLRTYFKRNSGTALADVAFQGRQFTATLGQEIVAFQRVGDD